MSVKVSLEQVVQQLTEAMSDAEKADSGNKAAGTRVRKAAQGAANALKDLRKQVLEARKEGYKMSHHMKKGTANTGQSVGLVCSL